MIQDLPILEDKFGYIINEPLLDYVRKVANHFWMDYDPEINEPVGYSSVVLTFASRYLNGDVDVSGKELFCESSAPKVVKTKHIKYTEFVKGQEGQMQDDNEQECIPDISVTLRAYGLDISKFWYLCVFLKDYVIGETIKGARIEQDSHRESLEKLVSLLEQLKPDLFGCFYKTIGEAELTLRVGKGKKNKMVICNGHTLALIRDGIQHVLDNYPCLDFSEVDFNDRLKTTRGNIVRIALFYKYMLWFLDSCSIDKEVVKQSIFSTSKILLISRMVYILGLSKNKKFLGESSETYLRTYISGYEEVKTNVENKFIEVVFDYLYANI